eukprot:357111-Chlamydomonas_euryale.AAC.3
MARHADPKFGAAAATVQLMERHADPKFGAAAATVQLLARHADPKFGAAARGARREQTHIPQVCGCCGNHAALRQRRSVQQGTSPQGVPRARSPQGVPQVRPRRRHAGYAVVTEHRQVPDRQQRVVPLAEFKCQKAGQWGQACPAVHFAAAHVDLPGVRSGGKRGV